LEVRFNRFDDEVEVLILTFVYAGGKAGWICERLKDLGWEEGCRDDVIGGVLDLFFESYKVNVYVIYESFSSTPSDRGLRSGNRKSPHSRWEWSARIALMSWGRTEGMPRHLTQCVPGRLGSERSEGLISAAGVIGGELPIRLGVEVSMRWLLPRGPTMRERLGMLTRAEIAGGASIAMCDIITDTHNGIPSYPRQHPPRCPRLRGTSIFQSTSFAV
jgi:hypothetical protein